MNYQFRWWREGGFRFPPLARLTNGRYGLGRWTKAESDDIHKSARDSVNKMKDLWE
jgi:hypothetical protein